MHDGDGIALPWLEPGDPFPAADSALTEPNGLLAAGADLSVDTLLRAYRQGIFPWFNEGEPPLWWTPDPRLVLLPQQLHISRSLSKRLRQNRFQLSINQQFSDVIQACAEPRTDQDGTWIVDEMQQAYQRLYQLGHAHSIEVWQQHSLVGGLYGIQVGAVFFGESMFSRQPDASKVAMALLCRLALKTGIELIDCQVESPHLIRLGAHSWRRQQFQQLVNTLSKKTTPSLPTLPQGNFAELLNQPTLGASNESSTK